MRRAGQRATPGRRADVTKPRRSGRSAGGPQSDVCAIYPSVGRVWYGAGEGRIPDSRARAPEAPPPGCPRSRSPGEYGLPFGPASGPERSDGDGRSWLNPTCSLAPTCGCARSGARWEVEGAPRCLRPAAAGEERELAGKSWCARAGRHGDHQCPPTAMGAGHSLAGIGTGDDGRLSAHSVGGS